jgi:hypothetical protein
LQGIQPLGPPAGLSRVEEAGDHRNEPVGAFDDGEVRRSWQYGELGSLKPGAVAIDAPDKSENLNRVLGPHDVGIANDDQRRRLDRLNLSGSPALELAVELIAFADESPPVLRTWGHPHVWA